MYPDVFENAPSRSVFESFSPVHTKTRKRYPLLSMRHATMYVNDVFLVYDIIVFETSIFVRPHEKGERFWKDEFSVTVFTGYVWAVGQTGEKKYPFSSRNVWEGP